MKRFVQILLVAAVGGAVVASSGCKQLEARDQINRGVAAFKAAQFNQAIENFQNAIQLDPTLTNAKLFLASAYQSQFIPGAPSEDNLKLAQEAMDEYKQILQDAPNTANAIVGLARLNFDLGNLDDAKTYYTKAVEVQPSDPTSYYALGAIAYQKTDKGIHTARVAMGLTNTPDAPMISKKSSGADKKTCENLRSQDEAILDDGITQLKKSLELRSDYADAMTYANLLYRDEADLTCGNDTVRAADIKIANDYVNQSLAIRKAEVAAQNKAAGGVVITNN